MFYFYEQKYLKLSFNKLTMTKVLHEMLQAEFPEGQYVPIDYWSEMLQVSKRDSKKYDLRLEQILEVGRRTLREIDYEIDIIKMDGQMSEKGGFVAMFFGESNGHFISMSHVTPFCTIATGWRGRSALTGLERKNYLALVRGYFGLFEG